MTVLALVGMLHLAGCTLPGSSGIAGNLFPESGGNPAIIGRSGVGLPQWAGARARRMFATLGNHWSDARYQIPYMLAELREFGLYDRTCLATEAGSAARVMMLGFLKPRSRDPRYRMDLARQIYAGAR